MRTLTVPLKPKCLSLALGIFTSYTLLTVSKLSYLDFLLGPSSATCPELCLHNYTIWLLCFLVVVPVLLSCLHHGSAITLTQMTFHLLCPCVSVKSVSFSLYHLDHRRLEPQACFTVCRTACNLLTYLLTRLAR